MNILASVPWEKIAAHLRDETARRSGPQGAIMGAGLGAAAAIARLQALNQKVTPQAIIAAAAIGLAYGAADKRRIGREDVD